MLLSYQRFLERALVSLDIQLYHINYKEDLKHYQQKFQLVLISFLYEKDLVLYLLSITGLLPIFDFILTRNDLLLSSDGGMGISTRSIIYPFNEEHFKNICFKLGIDSTNCLFCIDIPKEQKIQFSKFHFIDSFLLSNYASIYDSSINSSLIQQETKNLFFYNNKFNWKFFFIWFGIPILTAIFWYVMCYFFKSFLSISIITK